MTTEYTESTSTEHITLGGRMDYPLHRWCCEQWPQYGPTRIARALVLNPTIGAAKQFMEDEDRKVENKVGIAKKVSMICDVLYEKGCGDHLHAQQRADYRRDVAREILKRLEEAH